MECQSLKRSADHYIIDSRETKRARLHLKEQKVNDSALKIFLKEARTIPVERQLPLLAQKGSLKWLKLAKEHLFEGEMPDSSENSSSDSSNEVPILGKKENFFRWIDKPDANGNTPLMIYCEGRHNYRETFKVSEKIDHKRIQKNQKIREKEKAKWKAMIEQFVAWKCSLTRQNRFKESPIGVIVKNKLLEDQDLLFYIKNFSKEEIVSIADLIHHTSYEPLIEYFHSQGIPIDLPDRQGRSALYLAVDQFNVKLVKWLVSKGAEPSFMAPDSPNTGDRKRPIVKVELTPIQLFQTRSAMLNKANQNTSIVQSIRIVGLPRFFEESGRTDEALYFKYKAIDLAFKNKLESCKEIEKIFHLDEGKELEKTEELEEFRGNFENKIKKSHEEEMLQYVRMSDESFDEKNDEMANESGEGED